MRPKHNPLRSLLGIADAGAGRLMVLAAHVSHPAAEGLPPGLYRSGRLLVFDDNGPGREAAGIGEGEKVIVLTRTERG